MDEHLIHALHFLCQTIETLENARGSVTKSIGAMVTEEVGGAEEELAASIGYGAGGGTSANAGGGTGAGIG